MAKGLSGASKTKSKKTKTPKLDKTGQTVANWNTLGQSPANQQYAQQFTTYNNPNVTNPFGSQTITYDATGRPVINQQLSAAEQAKLQGQNAYDELVNKQSQGILSQANPADLNSNYADARKKAEDMTWNSYSSRLNPLWQKQNEDFAQQMANRGLGVGDPAWQRAMQTQGQNQSDAYLQAQNAAFQAGGQEVDRARQQALTPYSALSTLRGTYSGVNMPQFQTFQGANLQAPDLIGAATTINSSNNALKGAQAAAGATVEAARINAAARNNTSGYGTTNYNVG